MANHSVAASLINAASLSLLWEPVIPSPAGASGASARTRSHATAELSHCTLRSTNLKASALNLFLLLQHLIKIELFVLSFGAGAGPKKGNNRLRSTLSGQSVDWLRFLTCVAATSATVAAALLLLPPLFPTDCAH